jgi:hypothetical protein
MLHELLPQASHFGLLSDLKSPLHELMVKDARAAAFCNRREDRGSDCL